MDFDFPPSIWICDLFSPPPPIFYWMDLWYESSLATDWPQTPIMKIDTMDKKNSPIQYAVVSAVPTFRNLKLFSVVADHPLFWPVWKCPKLLCFRSVWKDWEWIQKFAVGFLLSLNSVGNRGLFVLCLILLLCF